MKVHVSAENIANGKRGCGRCPIELALLDAGLKRPQVGRGTASGVDREGKWRMAELPEKAKYFVARFDNYAAVRPITFELELR